MIPNGEGTINIGASELDNVIGQLGNCAEELKNMCSRLVSECETLKGAWHGECANAYEEVVNNIVSSVLTPMQRLLESYPLTLTSCKNEMFSHDQELAGAIRSAYSGIY